MEIRRGPHELDVSTATDRELLEATYRLTLANAQGIQELANRFLTVESFVDAGTPLLEALRRHKMASRVLGLPVPAVSS